MLRSSAVMAEQPARMQSTPPGGEPTAVGSGVYIVTKTHLPAYALKDEQSGAMSFGMREKNPP
jgi:hypothetical protein